MATLSLRNIDKIYPNKVQAVFNFNLEIKDKEFIVFVGPSGCGKSTTLRMIAGLEEISAGEFYIDGKLMNNVEPKDRNIAMVFQSYALYPHMTVYNNMAFSLKLRKTAHPIYETNNDVLAINDQIKAVRKELAKLDRVFAKKQNDTELLAKRKEIVDRWFALEDKKAKLLKPVMGKDEIGIKLATKEIASHQKEINFLTKKANLFEAKLKSPKNEKWAKDASEFIAKCNKQIAEHNATIAELTKNIEYLNSNDVALYELRKATKEEMDIEINKAADILDLSRYLYRKPAALSGGQRQRVALGRAIVRRPKVFLMDEPLSNLDAKLRVQTRSEISKLHKRVGATTIYVTHDQTEAMTMADRIVIMKDGYIQQIGTPEEVYSNPANKFVAGFIGSPAMNFLEGTYSKGTFTPKDTKIKIAVGAENEKILKAYEGKDVIFGVRPEAIQECKSGDLKLTCDFSELLGYETVIYSNVGNQRLVLKVEGKTRLKDEEEFSIKLDPKSFYFFDIETEKRI